MIVDDAYALQILKIGTMTPALRLDVPILVGSSTLCVEDPAIVEARSVYLYCCGRNLSKLTPRQLYYQSYDGYFDRTQYTGCETFTSCCHVSCSLLSRFNAQRNQFSNGQCLFTLSPFVRLPYAVRGDVRTETLAGEVI